MMPSSSSRKDAVRQTPPPSSKALRIGSWNVRSMYQTGKRAQIIREMQRNNLDILGISETHWNQSGQQHLFSGELFIFSGYDEDGPHREGVGLFISKAARKTLRGWEKHGPRMMMASFTTRKKDINMNIVQVYAPTNDAEDEDKDSFYNKLQDVVSKLPNKDVNIIMGDLNAKVGKDNRNYEQVMGKHGLGEMNDNGDRFLAFCTYNRMIIGGTVFPHKKIHKATWVSPDGQTENQIDHFCISGKFRRSMDDVRVLRGADVGSDHHLVLAKIRIKLKKYGKTSQGCRQKYQVSHLQDDGKKKDFQLELSNKFKALENLEDMTIEDHWKGIKEVVTSACTTVLGPKKNIHKEWITQESLDRIKKRRELKDEVNGSKTEEEKMEAREKYSVAHKEVKDGIKMDKNAFFESLAEKAEQAAANGHMRIVYQTTKTLSGKFSKPAVPVKDKEGKSIFEQKGQCDRWKEHFNELLNRPPPENPPDLLPARRDLQMNVEAPTKEEIAKALKLLKSHKAAGPDLIPPEALKTDIPTTVEILYGLFEKIWKEEKIPNDWKDGHLIKLPKKGDLSNCGNYRGITLLSIPGKVFNRILLERMKDTLDGALRENQAGFRKNRSCVDQIAALRIIVEQSEEWNSPLLVNFIDYEKAFDSVDRATLWMLMRHYGIPEKLVNLVKSSYDGTYCQVFHEGQLTDRFEVGTGVRQGCLLSPFLFILAIDWIMKETTRGRRNGVQWTPWLQLDDLDFADDLALLSHSSSQMQGKTDDLNTISKSVGLKIHKGKSKILKTGAASTKEVTLEDVPLEEVESFCYLGSIIDGKGGTEADVKARIGKARAAFTQLGKVWRATKISRKTKLRLFNSNVKSVLLYGCETWKATAGTLKKVQTFVNRCLRTILKIRWDDRVRNEDLWERAGQVPMKEEIGKRKWRWIGHTLRKPKGNITRQSLRWNPQGNRGRKRPRETWRRCVEREMVTMGHSWGELTQIAQDRGEWKLLVCGLCSDPG